MAKSDHSFTSSASIFILLETAPDSGTTKPTKPCHLSTSNLTKIWSELPFRCLLAFTQTSRTKNQLPAKYAEESPPQDRISAVLFPFQHFFNKNINFKNYVFRTLSRNGFKTFVQTNLEILHNTVPALELPDSFNRLPSFARQLCNSRVLR
jgi:hypothetical protein